MNYKKFWVIAIAIVFITFIFLGSGSRETEFDWPRLRGPNGDGISLETQWNPEALVGGPQILWKTDIGWGHSNVAIKDTRLYTMGTKGGKTFVYCLSAETGELIWQNLSGIHSEPNTTPTIDDKNVYALGRDGLLLCINTKNGKIRWKRDLISEDDVVRPQYGVGGSPVIEEDLIILNLNLSGIAFNKNNGKKVWISDKYHPSNTCPQGKNMASYATPVIYDWEGKRCALMYHCTGLYSVELQTGQQMWYFEFMAIGAKATDPIFFENKVFISTGYINARCVLMEITENKPKILWQNENMRNEFSACVFIDGFLYGSDGDHGELCPFRCIDVRTGDVLWEKEMKMASVTAADGKLIILEENGTLHIAQATPSAYQEISSCDLYRGEKAHRLFYTPPVLCNGRIYCRNFSGDLFCLDVSN